MKIALVFLDALQPGGYPRDVRWLAETMREKGLDVSLVASPGAHMDGLGEVEVIDPHRALEGVKDADIVHNWGLLVPSQLALLTRIVKAHSGALVISPLGQLMPFHLRHRALPKKAYLYAARLKLRSWTYTAHFFSQEDCWPSLRLLNPVHSFEATLGWHEAPPEVPAETGDRGDYLLFFGRNDVAQKGLDTLALGYSMAVARGLDLPLLVAGRQHGESAEFWARARRAEHGGRIEVLGPVEQDRAWALLSGASCLVFPSRWDGPPRPIREAISVGTPVIATIGTNMAQLIDFYGAGEVAATEPSSLMKAMLLAGDADQRARWREGVRLLRDRLTWDRVADDYIAGYEAALSAGARR